MRSLTFAALTLALALALALAPAAADDEKKAAPAWPTYHGGYDLTGIAGSRVPDAPVARWRFNAGSPVVDTPVAGDGRIYFTTEKGALIALDHAGQQVWKTEIKPAYFGGPAMFADGLIVAGTTEGKLLAFAADSGEQRWAYDVDDNIMGSANRVDPAGGEPAIVITAQATGVIHCVDIATGKGLWKTGEEERCDGSVGVGAGRIVMGSCASALHVFGVAEAKKLIDVPLGEERQVAGGVAIAGTTAYAGTRAGAVAAVDLEAGKVLWVNTDTDREAFTTPAVSEKLVIFGSDDGHVYALDRATGKQAWKFDTERAPYSAAIAGDRVVVSSEGTLYLLDLATGKEVFSKEVSDEITAPAIVDGMIVVGAEDGTVTAFGAKK